MCVVVLVFSERVEGEGDRKLRTKEETVVLEERMKDGKFSVYSNHTQLLTRHPIVTSHLDTLYKGNSTAPFRYMSCPGTMQHK